VSLTADTILWWTDY